MRQHKPKRTQEKYHLGIVCTLRASDDRSRRLVTRPTIARPPSGRATNIGADCTDIRSVVLISAPPRPLSALSVMDPPNLYIVLSVDESDGN